MTMKVNFAVIIVFVRSTSSNDYAKSSPVQRDNSQTEYPQEQTYLLSLPVVRRKTGVRRLSGSLS